MAKTMTIETAVKNAIASSRMEGFVLTDDIEKLISDTAYGKITYAEAICILDNKWDREQPTV